MVKVRSLIADQENTQIIKINYVYSTWYGQSKMQVQHSLGNSINNCFTETESPKQGKCQDYSDWKQIKLAYKRCCHTFETTELCCITSIGFKAGFRFKLVQSQNLLN